MRFFVDANVLIAVLNREYPVFPYAARALSLSDNPKFSVCTSPICLAIAFYFAEKKSGTSLARNKISVLSEKLEIAAADVETVRLTLKNKAIHDFEDGLEYYAACQSHCQVIVSEDMSDFYFSEIPVQDCATFLGNIGLK